MLWLLWTSLFLSPIINAKAFQPLNELAWYPHNSTRASVTAAPEIQMTDLMGRPYTPPARKIPKFYFLRCKAGEKDLKTLACNPECPDGFEDIGGKCVKNCLPTFSRVRMPYVGKHICDRRLTIWDRKCNTPCNQFGEYWVDSGICHCRLEAETYVPEIDVLKTDVRPGCFPGDKPIKLHEAQACINCVDHSYDARCGGAGQTSQAVAGF